VKTIHLILLGMVIFNAMLITTASFFPATIYESGAEDIVNSSNYSSYRELNSPTDLIGAFFSTESLAAIGGIFGVAIVGTVLSRNLIPMGIGGGLALFTGIYISVSKVFLGLSDNPIILAFITIIGIGIGLILVMDAMEALKGRQDV